MFNSSCVVMIPARVRTLLGVLLLAVASPAQKGGDMPQLIDKVMLQAAERYADMASGLEKGKMPRTICRITQQGIAAFDEYVAAIRDYLNVATDDRTKL